MNATPKNNKNFSQKKKIKLTTESSQLDINNKSLFNSKKDLLFKKPLYSKSSFVFDERVSEVFDDMITRSIPYYEEVIRLSGEFLFSFGKGGILYDLGCSTGNFILSLLALHSKKLSAKSKTTKIPAWNYVGIDSSQAMIDRAKRKYQILFGDISESNQTKTRLSQSTTFPTVSFFCQDVTDLSFFLDSDLVVRKTTNNFFTKKKSLKLGAVTLQYTLQFIPLKKRKFLLKNIYRALITGGLLILSEKVEEEITLDKYFTEEYYRFKSTNRYSHTEINRKRAALDKVLVPLTTELYLNMLKEVGFSEVAIAFKWNNFVTFFAVK